MSVPLSAYYQTPTANILPHEYLEILVLFLLVFAVLASYFRIRSWGVPFTPLSVLSTVMTSRDREREGEAIDDVGLVTRAKVATRSTIHDIFLLRRAGAWCEERIHTIGRGLVLWGFVLLSLVTLMGFLIDPAGTPNSLFLPLRLSGDIFQGILAMGACILLLRRLSRQNLRISTDINTWALQSVLFVMGVSGVIADFSLLMNLVLQFQVAYLVNVASIIIFFIYAPFSELTFLIWKGSLLMQETLSTNSAGGK
jgi:hypothetical protein